METRAHGLTASDDAAAPSLEALTDAGEGNPRTATASFPIVGVGASAGGLEALEAFFHGMPADSGVAFVVIQHLSPDFRSLMDELLSRRTQIAIHRVEDGMAVEPNAIYLIPPKKEMIVADGRLLLTDKDPSSGLSLPIDTFFRSLAQDAGERAVAVILSGTGSDGSRGVRAVHEAGGLVIVQSEDTAKFDGMPRSAIETGHVDLVLPPSAMAQALLAHVRHPRYSGKGARLEPLVREAGINAIYGLLRGSFGIDFSHYKPNTVLRRIDRRLQLNHAFNLEEYVEQLQRDPRELNSLYKDLLIGVTRFFRDPALFERLSESVIPELLERTPPDEEIRAWVAGCATGEEAYSLAMLLHEALTARGRPPHVKIFATDVHRTSLDFASVGLYNEAALSEVSPQRRERYFTPQASGFQVSSELRKLIVFAPHNVIKDAPFTKLDLISCRNLLIYLGTPAQNKSLSLFHFGLKTGGTLVLGPSESPGDLNDEFETLDGHWKIYRKRRDVRLPTDLRLPISPVPLPAPGQASTWRMARSQGLDPHLLRAYDELLGAYVPPSFLVSGDRQILHTFGGAGQFLRMPDGRPSNDLLDLVDAEVRLALAGCLQRAAQQKAPSGYSGVVRETPSGPERLKVSVRPLLGRGEGDSHYLVSLEPEARRLAPGEPSEGIDLDAASRERVGELEEELRYAKENLQATIEEMETTNEELQATNEELVASNEELQSTNEELHSVNEELYTVNAEYQRKIVELTELTDDIDNLLRSTDVGTIFLDRELRIRKFTPQIAHAFQLLPQDVGRRIDAFAQNILHEGLLDDVRRVLETEEVIECDVQDRSGHWLLLRVLPYRSKGRVEGVVVTLIGISRLKATEAELRRLSKVFMDGADPIIIEDLSGRILDVNREAEKAYGWSRDELLGQQILNLVPSECETQARELRQRCRREDSVRNVESMRRDRQGNLAAVLLTLSLIHDEQGRPAAIASISKDITALKQAEAEAHEAARRRDQFLAMLSHELRNPLGAILNAARLIERLAADESLRQAATALDRQSKQIARLLEDLLDVARVTQGKIHVRREPVDLRAVTLEAVSVVRPTLDSLGHKLVLQLPESPLYVQGDWARLLQVQENLLENAAKYTPNGGEIRLSLEGRGSEAVFAVRDSGCGIAPEMLERIFELFVQAPPLPGHTAAGMGIGLTMVKSIVALHGGKVAVRSEGPGRGSEFEVRLPLTDDRPAVHSADATGGDSPVRVVIVEDNADSRELLASLLALDGHDVRAAPDGVRGYAAIAEDRPDVALVDLDLPGMSGYEIARKVRRELGDSVRLVALTGFGRLPDREAVSTAGFNEHLVKPVDPDDLARVLRAPA